MAFDLLEMKEQSRCVPDACSWLRVMLHTPAAAASRRARPSSLFQSPSIYRPGPSIPNGLGQLIGFPSPIKRVVSRPSHPRQYFVAWLKTDVPESLWRAAHRTGINAFGSVGQNPNAHRRSLFHGRAIPLALIAVNTYAECHLRNLVSTSPEDPIHYTRNALRRLVPTLQIPHRRAEKQSQVEAHDPSLQAFSWLPIILVAMWFLELFSDRWDLPP